ncbi:MAG TPA: molybdopterin molybdotransferase MoeA [Micromonosporaceae bacterium]|nr:molybdopterin molybdotransferase MoeA [Micromonosporaceae bacterium]
MSDQPVSWVQARESAYAAGQAAAAATGPVDVPLAVADGLTLAEPLVTLTDLPAFPTSSVDGWAVRGPAPWRITGRVLAGAQAKPLTEDGTAVEIATGAMVPDGAEAIVRVEESTTGADGRVSGTPREQREWREPGEEAHRGEELLPAGTPVSPGVVGLAASCGYETLTVYPRPEAALLVFGDELLTVGLPGGGRVRDALGPQLPAWLARLGGNVVDDAVIAPVGDTLDAHVDAIRGALAGGAGIVCTTGGTMHGPVDHLHPALHKLGAEYIANTVAVRPGFPMLLARFPTGQFLAGLPGNPQSAVVALVTLVAPLIAGLTGRVAPRLPEVTLAEPIAGRGGHTHLALVRQDPDGRVRPQRHVASSMLRGLASSIGFAVVAPGTNAEENQRVPLVPLPLLEGERA